MMVRSWTAGGNLNTGRINMAAAGTSNSSRNFWWMVLQRGNTGATELYDGTSWSNSASSMATGKQEGANWWKRSA